MNLSLQSYDFFRKVLQEWQTLTWCYAHFALKWAKKWYTWVDFELLTATESQTLRASEIQWRYNWPNFDAFSSLFWLTKILVFAHRSWQKLKMPQNWKLNNLNKLLNLAHSWRLVLLRKTLRFALLRNCTFLYRSLLGALCFCLCFSYLQKSKSILYMNLISAQGHMRNPPNYFCQTMTK